ncbi:DUF262 domain-containing protein [Aliarcobacter butzleri]|uniref:DUF262 domain-containing protein n=1 Tax=Aliarcobacter butzleri TaxID=28197 RepID=UPI002B24C8A1|nr:DUF262 domain-containing protein [Aliarcobacter butzleri]
MKNTLELKTINELQQFSFYIPSYQRGYRWSANEVKDLLNDISEFTPRIVDEESNERTWYCLQPIVVKKRENGQFEVIDGQQRLTTIYLILYYINQGYVEDRRMKLFDLHYETRENSASFLQDLTKETNDESNIDFYHISNAYKTICDWFSDPSFNINDFESNFKFHSKVIWYESAEDEPIAIFTRINIGKIPLTNAELIKALFLNSSNFDKKKNDKIRLKQLEISSEWDYIEQSLQNNRFWYFLNGNNVTTNRIEFIFELMNNEKDYNDDYSTFRFFNKKFVKKNQETIEYNWLEIKKYFQRFQEWFEERDLYHKIGYLIAIESITIADLYNRSINLSKTEFRTLLDDAIKSDLKNVTLESLQYGDKQIKKVLLLYNILTMLNNENDNAYFPFDIYKNEKWDIEHITSITDAIPKQKSSWLNDAKVFIDVTEEEGVQLKTRADTCDCENDVVFEALFKDIVKHFNSHLEDEDINDISNLALLDSETNRGYKNAVFPLKRKTIIDREKKGTFIPICTKNVFLKYFSSYPPKISFWTQEDRDNYYKDLAKVLENYIEKDI